MTLTEARQAVATALSTVAGWNVRPRPLRAAPKAGDGWVVLNRLEPADFTRSTATMTAVLILGADEAKAELRLEQDATALINAITGADDLAPADVALEAISLAVGDTAAPLYGAALTLTLEVD